ncbi:MAG TPA: hypothetical protein VLC09_20890 [Polyangiaceae bacterium]|nr:hypothetical protein [Polyangiaceae bacterium]
MMSSPTPLRFAGFLIATATFASCSNGANDDRGPDGSATDSVGSDGSTDAPDSGAPDAGSGGTGPQAPAPGCEQGYRELSDGFSGVHVERVCWPDGLIDQTASLAAFEQHVYPLLLAHCAECHSSTSAGQAPLHSDANVELAHQYALTRVNFSEPQNSKLVVRLEIDRHNCFGAGCQQASQEMLAAVGAWAAAVAPSLPETPRGTPADETIQEGDLLAWIAADRATLAEADRPFVKYASLHELHNSGASARDLDIARVALSKALNTAARWAPELVNPSDVNGKGLLYRFDTRDYWGYNKGVTKLNFGGSDDDAAFGRTTVNYLGEPVGQSVFQERYSFAPSVSVDPAFATLVWNRILAGNVEGATDSGVLPPNTDGFHDEYVEASQLVYTLTRPDVYNAIMAIPWFADALEDELGIDRAAGANSYEWMLTQQAITVDARLYFRARQASGTYYWKTWDVFTGQLPSGISTIEQAYEQGQIRFPFWANPIPRFVSPFSDAADPKFSFIATLAQTTSPAAGCDGQPNYGGSEYVNCRWFTGQGGLQQSAEEVIWGLPNGLQGYALFGGFNQRRVDAFVNIVRDPRILRSDSDAQINDLVGFASADRRLNTGSSCIGCHADGMNRGNNDLRDWLDFAPERLPHGARGVDGWVDDPTTVERVKELYPPSQVMRARMEDDRRRFLGAQARIARGMMLDPNPNVFVEPAIWTIEWARDFYQYPTTRSN